MSFVELGMDAPGQAELREEEPEAAIVLPEILHLSLRRLQT